MTNITVYSRSVTPDFPPRSLKYPAPLDWLLDPTDPSARWRALREMFDRSESDPDIRQVRVAITSTPAVQSAFESRKPDGTWGDLGKEDAHHGTAWMLSWLLQAGTTLAEVGKQLGHTSSATTERYAHLQEKPSEAAVNALRRARRAADVQQPAATDRSTALQRGHLRLVK